jgi:ABC-type transport system substrate-binding protein
LSKKGIATNTAIFILIIVILIGSLVGVVWYYSTLPSPVTPPPGEFQFSDLTVEPDSVSEGGSVTVTVNVTNTAGVEITGTITLLVDNAKEDEESITLAGETSQIVTFTVTKDPGDYEVSIAGYDDTALFSVQAGAPPFVADNKVVFETGATYQWLDPHVSYYQFDYWTLWHSVETLLWYEGDNATKIIPWLAESIDEITVGGEVTQYNLTLRQDITFQDGTPFNATAVWFSFNRILIIDGTSGDGLNPGSQAAWMVQQLLNASLAKGVSGDDQAYDEAWVKAVLDQEFVTIFDEYHVRLNLMTPTTQFYPIMAGPWAGIISPTSAIEMEYAANPTWGTWDGNFTEYYVNMAGKGDTALVLPEDGWEIGTGAYYVESVEATAPYTIVLKAYDDYWGGPDNMNLPPVGKPRIETIEYRYIPSFTTRLLDLRAGTATGIAVPTANIFQVVDRDMWIDDGILESIISGVVEHGPFSQFTTWWLDYNTNVTNPDGTLRDWQPFADWRIRMAVSSAVNMTDMNINVNNRLGIVASNIVPPGTFPPGSYNTDVEPTFSFNLTRAEELLNASRDDPLTSFTFYENGTAVPSGTIDNSFGPNFAFGKPIEFYVQSGADQFQAVLTQMADALNAICVDNDLGIKFSVVIVPGGQQYTLASAHYIDSYVGGWIADYNHVLNWLSPMYLSSGPYFSWNRWNLTALDTRYADALLADQAGDVDELLTLNDEMNTIANEALMYMVWWHPTLQFARSTWLQGWSVNVNYGVDLWSTMYYEQP